MAELMNLQQSPDLVRPEFRRIIRGWTYRIGDKHSVKLMHDLWQFKIIHGTLNSAERKILDSILFVYQERAIDREWQYGPRDSNND